MVWGLKMKMTKKELKKEIDRIQGEILFLAQHPLTSWKTFESIKRRIDKLNDKRDKLIEELRNGG